MAGIMDFFQGTATPEQAVGQGQQVTPESQKTAMAEAGVPNAFAGTKADPSAAASPLDAFTEVFKVDPNKAVMPNDPLFKMDEQKLAESIANMEFAPQIQPDIMHKIMAGDAGALQKLLNQSTQQAFRQAVQMTQKMVEHGVTTSASRMETQLPDKFRSMQAQQTLQDDPVFSHEAMKPMVSALQQQFSAKYPNASGPQISKMVKDFMQATAETISPQKAAAPQNAAEFFAKGDQGNTNFFDFFGGGR